MTPHFFLETTMDDLDNFDLESDFEFSDTLADEQQQQNLPANNGSSQHLPSPQIEVQADVHAIPEHVMDTQDENLPVEQSASIPVSLNLSKSSKSKKEETSRKEGTLFSQKKSNFRGGDAFASG